jgi:hypothetical protein
MCVVDVCPHFAVLFLRDLRPSAANAGGCKMEDAAEKVDEQPAPTWVQLESVIPLRKYHSDDDDVITVETVTTLSPDTVERKYGDYVIRLSARRKGMKLRNALLIAAGKAPKS